MAVNTDGNKQLLLQLLYEHPLKINNPNDFMQIFNDMTNNMHDVRFQYNNDLITMNKEILRQFQSMIPIQHKWGMKKVLPTSETDEQVPRLKIFETRLKEQQDDFNNMIKAEIPDDIDFSDNVKDDTTITSNTVDATMQKRQQELRKIMTGYQKDKKAEAWIKGDNIKPNITELLSTSKSELPPMIKNEQSVPKNKQVSFENVSSDLLHKLKIKPIEEQQRGNDDSYYFKQIITNQELILQELIRLNAKG